MNDDVKEQNSMPPEELKRQIMSYSEPKNEREWWAMHRIEQLEAALRDVIDSWDWWQVDTYDRCASVPGDAIATARAALEGKDD